MSDFSSIFGGSSSNSNNFGLGSINFSDYKMIKSGSYKKLMTAYYKEQNDTTSKSSSSSSTSSASSSKKTTGKKSTLDKILEDKMARTTTTYSKEASNLNRMKSEAESLKTTAEAFDANEVFNQENGKYDTDKIVKSVNDFVNQYNAVIDQAGKVASTDVAVQVGYMQRLTDTMSKALEKVGITINKEGKLDVDEEKLKGADMKEVEALFSGSHSYAAEIANKSLAIQSAVTMDSNFYTNLGTHSSSNASSYSSQV